MSLGTRKLSSINLRSKSRITQPNWFFYCHRGLKDNLPNDDDDDEDKDGDNGSSASNDQERPVVDADNADDASDIGAEFLGTLEEAASATQDDEDV